MTRMKDDATYVAGIGVVRYRSICFGTSRRQYTGNYGELIQSPLRVLGRGEGPAGLGLRWMEPSITPRLPYH